MDPNSIEPPTQFQKIVDERKVLFSTNLTYQLSHISHPKSFTNNPEGQHYLLLVLVMPKKCQRASSTNVIPEDFDSILDDTGSIRVKSIAQVLFVTAVQFQLAAYRHQVPDPICEMCELTLAQWYCPADSAHLCDSCDKKHHASSAILSRHSRLLVSQSPFLFGYCSTHPSEKVNVVCTICYKSLCPSCEAFGVSTSTPSLDEFSLGNTTHQHALISTTDAYKNSQSDIISSKELTDDIKNKHQILLNLYSNYKSTQDKVDHVTTALLSQLDRHFKRQTDYLDSRYRQLKLYSNTLEWLISFMDHLTLALGAAEFVYLKRKFDLFVENFTEKISLKIVHPKWLMQPIEFWGGFTVETKCSDENDNVTDQAAADEDYLDKYDLTKPIIPGVNQPVDESFAPIYNFNINEGPEVLSLYQSNAQDTSELGMNTSSPKNMYPNNYLHEVASLAPSNAIYNSAQRDLYSPVNTNIPIESSVVMTSHTPIQIMKVQSPIAQSDRIFHDQCVNLSVIITPLMVDSLWGLLSEHRFLPLIGLVASCNVTKRMGFLQDLAKLANSYNSLHLLIHDYIRHLKEKNTPEFLMLRSVGSLFDLFSWSLIGELSTMLEWFDTKLAELDMKYESLERCIENFVFDLSSGHIPEPLAWSLYQLSSSKLGTDLIASLSASLVTRGEIGGDDSRHIAYSLSKLGMLIWHGDQNGHLPNITKKLHRGVERFLKMPKKVVNLRLKHTGDATAVASAVVEPLLALKKEIYGEAECGSSQFDVNIDVPNLHEILKLVADSSLPG